LLVSKMKKSAFDTNKIAITQKQPVFAF